MNPPFSGGREPAQHAEFGGMTTRQAVPSESSSHPASAQKPDGDLGGINLVGLISLLAILVLVLGVAWVGNRVWPISSRIDSAWRSAEGNARELTSYLRSEGFTCSDETMGKEAHFHRLCARFTDTDKLAIEFAGPTSGEIMRVHVDPHGPLTPDEATVAARAIELSVPDQTSQGEARRTLESPSAAGVDGPWGRAFWANGTFNVVRTWTGPSVGGQVPGSIGTVRDKAAQAGYRCDDGAEVLQCQRIANGAQWVLTVHQSANPERLSNVLLSGRITDAKQLDPVAELDTVLPASPELRRMKWFVSTANQHTGQAGFARGVRVSYVVTPNDVSIDAGTACRLVDGVITC